MADTEKQVDAGAVAAEDATASLLDQLVNAARIKQGDDAYSITRHGIQAFVSQLLEPQRAVERVTAATVDDMIADLDKKLCAQVDAILHTRTIRRWSPPGAH